MTVDAGVKQEFKQRLFNEFARIGKALASPYRLEILELLAQGERTVESIATQTGLTVANTSRHLQQLRQAQLVLARRDGVFIHYRLAGREVVNLILALRHTGETHLGERNGFEPVTSNELARRIDSGEVVVLDVRPEHEFAAGHITGALSMPAGDLGARLGELPLDQEYVAYGRGPCCVHADEAVGLLQANGRTARRLCEGYPDWWLAGRPVSVDRSG